MSAEKKDQNITVRMPIENYRWLAELAVRERRSLSGQLIALVDEARERDQKDNPKPTDPTD